MPAFGEHARAAAEMRTWVRRDDAPVADCDPNEVLVWIQNDDKLFYVLLASGVFKLASIVTYEGMHRDWEPCSTAFLEVGSAN